MKSFNTSNRAVFLQEQELATKKPKKEIEEKSYRKKGEKLKKKIDEKGRKELPHVGVKKRLKGKVDFYERKWRDKESSKREIKFL